MHSALSIASLLLAASGALALPTPQESANITTSSYPLDTEVRVILQDQATETGATTTFKSVDVRKQKKALGGQSAEFQTIDIKVGADGNPDLRCQALDLNGVPKIARRGANIDVTFSDGGVDKNEWTFVTPGQVSKIICDPNFVQATPGDFDIRVTLANTADELATQTVFEAFEGSAELPPTGSNGPFTTVDILVGAGLNPDLRCKVVDRRGREIVATRGENVDTTFSDGGPDKAEWTFESGRPRRVSKIICDETFVANPQ